MPLPLDSVSVCEPRVTPPAPDNVVTDVPLDSAEILNVPLLVRPEDEAILKPDASARVLPLSICVAPAYDAVALIVSDVLPVIWSNPVAAPEIAVGDVVIALPVDITITPFAISDVLAKPAPDPDRVSVAPLATVVAPV